MQVELISNNVDMMTHDYLSSVAISIYHLTMKDYNLHYRIGMIFFLHMKLLV